MFYGTSIYNDNMLFTLYKKFIWKLTLNYDKHVRYYSLLDANTIFFNAVIKQLDTLLYLRESDRMKIISCPMTKRTKHALWKVQNFNPMPGYQLSLPHLTLNIGYNLISFHGLKSFLIFHFLQLNDCHRGVVFDGLETLFSQTLFTTTNAILKSLNNRRFIYFVTLKLDYAVLKEQEKKAQEERGTMSCIAWKLFFHFLLVINLVEI